ncbi:MAG: pilus assembly protein TadE [Actinobacteria bacterium]|nr:pilus assembly protein TadE [Actinomycetota bacterium]
MAGSCLRQVTRQVTRQVDAHSRDCRRAGGGGGERGSATAVLLVAAVVIAGFGQVGLVVAHGHIARLRLQAVADVAALAGAGQESGCALARRLAAANGVTVASCSTGFSEARVVVIGPRQSTAPWLPRLRARARAGFG